MAKSTFYNLDQEKQGQIYTLLKEFFEEADLEDINVSAIVKKLGIARGSFYQYFEDLADCYFTVLQKASGQIHHEFIQLLQKNNQNLEETLYAYRDYLVDQLYEQNLKNLYRAKFFLFEGSFISHGKASLKKSLKEDDYQRMLYLMAVFHQLIKESITENYDKNRFTSTCNLYILWLLGGLSHASI
ncbi:MAG: TetR/AcrR family transcriptional regulator [Peptoniphilus sp. oral taxon 375]|nr:TetR/AcrR family transcriptional regulator [Peptoniphilus sp. oral taxon 375]